MTEYIDLIKKLKDCPRGTQLWSDTRGEVTFEETNPGLLHPITLKDRKGHYFFLTRWGNVDEGFPECCTLWPQKNMRNWNEWEYPKPKKAKFDPKTFKAFDKVIIRRKFDGCYLWFPSLFAYYNDGCRAIDGHFYLYMIPYNDETKHLVYTKDEAPEHYRYWED